MAAVPQPGWVLLALRGRPAAARSKGHSHDHANQAGDRDARRGPGARRLNPDRAGVAYLGALLFAADDLVLCLFCGATRAGVIEASERLGIPSERLMDAAWLGPHPPVSEGAQQ